MFTDGSNKNSPIQIGAPLIASEGTNTRRSRLSVTITNNSDKEVKNLQIGAQILDPDGKNYRDCHPVDLPSLGPKKSYDTVTFFLNDALLPVQQLKAKVWVKHAP